MAVLLRDRNELFDKNTEFKENKTSITKKLESKTKDL
jgi:hypothetical protein